MATPGSATVPSSPPASPASASAAVAFCDPLGEIHLPALYCSVNDYDPWSHGLWWKLLREAWQLGV
eukprot:CAMPEP_0115878094 /NCGR_PEP_ID=MMETSP0287-20121206/26586_1 /TAXON_ID=412157 /ORGANISM="Chrysochromulina rotalis, Strain UIO044" /LENGTH=65 /DNA_ID=CAMNT_0003333679 /DNA_START=408 /DNA_END=605 /DNA_ORIENTATION=-